MRSEFEKLFKAQRSYRSSDKEAFIRGCEAAYKHQQSKVDELQKQRDSFIKAYEIEMDKSVELQKKNAWLSDVACRENKRANKLQEEKVSTTALLGKTIQEKNELQKRVDQQGLIIANVMSIASDLQKSWEMFEIGKKLEQALKGGGE